MSDILLTDSQRDLQLMFREFAKKEVMPISAQYDEKGEFPREIFNKAVEMGLTTLGVPEKFGGSGEGALTGTLLGEELGYADAGFAVAVGACNLATIPVMMGGNEAQVKKVADLLLHGGMTAFCLTEAEAGSDAAALRTTAVKDGNDYIINGSKVFITNGGVADMYTVFATVDRSLGAKGITAFLVDRNSPGLSVGKEENKMGIRLSNTTEVVFEDVRVSAENIVGGVGKGLKIALGTLSRTRAQGSSAAVGICRRAIEESMRYAKQRVTFGRPIIKNQAIQFMLADMEIQTEAARQLVRHAARMVDKGVIDAKQGSIAKTFAGDTAVKVTTDAIQIFGGYGYSREYPVEKLLRDAKIYQIFEGTNQIQRMVIFGNMINQ
ncbi:Acyl-CoA dehydrogenase [bioreactor metagenome]|uniref:Acyl-CoA dehydrogenase n=1 Tax=bioreactor metagenome TaxID=1076179 RepID=A0A644W5F9_9ZZZZ